MSEPDLPGPPLRIAVLGNFDSPHTRRWLRVFVERGHEVHAVSYYAPNAELPGVHLHVLSRRAAPSAVSSGVSYATAGFARGLAPPSFQRLVQAWRYRRAGLRRVLDGIGPDVFHAHYAVEHGFYGAFAGFHPYVVSAWGSDLLVDSRTTPGRLIARYALRQADFVSAHDQALARRAVELGVPVERVAVVRLGIDATFLEAGSRSVNLRPPDAAPPTVISDRALEPLYNVDAVIRAFARLGRRLPSARLVVAGEGSERPRLEALAAELGQGDTVRFVGQLEAPALAEALAAAHVYVSVPDSDALALSTMEAMAAGAFPIVSDLPSQDWITHGVNGLRVPPRNADALAGALHEALTNDALRRAAVEPNRAKVESEGLLEPNMLLMERHYYRLAGHPVGSSEVI